jgi:lysophospholipase L1-like esterase
VALIDLTNLSLTYYATLGAGKSALTLDGTHFHEAGATQIAGLVARAIKASTITGLQGHVL